MKNKHTGILGLALLLFLLFSFNDILYAGERKVRLIIPACN